MIRLLFLLPFISLSLFSCTKRARCKSNCYELRISGHVSEYETMKKLEGIKLQVYWEDEERGFVTFPRTVKNSRTREDGSFDFIVNIDTTEFSKGQALRIATYSDIYSDDVRTMDALEPEIFSGIELKVYRRKEGL